MMTTEIICRRPHRGKGRAILPGQKIHASVAFKAKSYKPKATFIGDRSNLTWNELIGEGHSWNFRGSGLADWQQHLEMDLFDHTSGSDAFATLADPNLSSEDVVHILKRITFIANTGKCLKP
jgi:hypothetical protein